MTTLRQMGAKIGSRVRFIEDPEGQWRTVKTDAELDYEHLLPWVVENKTMTDTTHEAPDLLPCPFCGGEARYYHRPDTTGWSNTDWVSCGDCGASTCMHETKEEATAAWNTRSDDLVQAAVTAALIMMPIGTAPRNGTPIVVVPHGDVLDVQVSWFIDEEGRWANWNWSAEPSHWMRLPAAIREWGE